MTTTAPAVLAEARKWIGYKEGANNDTVFGKWYGLNYNPWCDMFVSYVFNATGGTDIGGKFAYTPSHANWFKAQGRWGTTPKVGAVVFFYYEHLGRIGHVGIVESVNPDGSIVTIEGNTNTTGSRVGDGVYRMIRTQNIIGYGYPAYDEVVVPTPPPVPVPPPPPPPPPKPTRHYVPKSPAPAYRQGGKVYSSKMHYGQKDSDSVWNLQRALIHAGESIPAGPTGNYLDQTVAACASFQRKDDHLDDDPDGIAGPQTVAHLGLVWVNG